VTRDERHLADRRVSCGRPLPDNGQDEYRGAAEGDHCGVGEPLSLMAASAVSIAALLLVCSVLLAAGLGR
jgi:hypothetical protein